MMLMALHPSTTDRCSSATGDPATDAVGAATVAAVEAVSKSKKKQTQLLAANDGVDRAASLIYSLMEADRGSSMMVIPPNTSTSTSDEFSR